VSELRLVAGANETLNRLKEADFLCVVLTNQPDVARGSQSRRAVDAIHDELSRHLPIDAIYSCFHDDVDRCECRKPLPGLFKQAARDLDIDLSRSFMIGDRWRDIEAANAAGVDALFIDYAYAEPSPEGAHIRTASLDEAAAIILERLHMHASQPLAQPAPPGLLRTHIYADGAELSGIKKLAADPAIKGFTTNPTLMRKAGVTDYAGFAREVLEIIGGRPISFEIFADEPVEMERQARTISAWAENIYVKIPVTTTTGAPTTDLVRHLAAEGVRLNVTALMTAAQVANISAALGDSDSFISVFAGRVADTGRDPLPIMIESLAIMRPFSRQRLIWASPRELLNIYQADEIGCHVITVTHDILAKLGGIGKDLDQYSLETVQMFHRDASASSYAI